MPNEKVGGKADQLPKNKQHDEVVSEDDAEHGKHEEGESGKIAGSAFVRVHVSQRIDVNKKSDAANENEHGPAEPIKNKAERNMKEIWEVDPGLLRRGNGWL